MFSNNVDLYQNLEEYIRLFNYEISPYRQSFARLVIPFHLREIAATINKIYQKLSIVINNVNIENQNPVPNTIKLAGWEKELEKYIAKFFKFQAEFSIAQNLQESGDAASTMSKKRKRNPLFDKVILKKDRTVKIFNYQNFCLQEMQNSSLQIFDLLQQSIDSAILQEHEIKSLVGSMLEQMERVFVDINEHEKDLRFRKCGIDNVSKATFWIFYDSSKQMFSVDIIVPTKEIVGKGTYKKIKLGYRLKIPIFNDSFDERQISIKKLAVIRPKDAENKETLFQTDETHKRLKGRLQVVDKRDALITKLPKKRFYTGRKGAEKVEFMQTKYLCDMRKISTVAFPATDFKGKLSTKERIQFIRELFTTLSIFHDQGIVHRDVSPDNVLLNTKDNASFHAYLNDFDLLSETFIQFRDDYQYWDIASQRGLVTPMTDIVGGLITAIEVIFPVEISFKEDKMHNILRKDEFESRLISSFNFTLVERQLSAVGLPNVNLRKCKEFREIIEIIKRSNIQADIKADVLRQLNAFDKIVKLIKRVFQQEMLVYAKLLVSNICYLTDLGALEFDKLREQKDLTGMIIALENGTKRFLEKSINDSAYNYINGLSLQKYLENQSVDINDLGRVYNAICDLGESDNSIYTKETLGKIKRLTVALDVITLNKTDFITAFDFQANKTKQSLLLDPRVTSANPEMIANLESTDPEKRKRGIEAISKEFTTAKEIAAFFSQLEADLTIPF